MSTTFGHADHEHITHSAACVLYLDPGGGLCLTSAMKSETLFTGKYVPADARSRQPAGFNLFRPARKPAYQSESFRELLHEFERNMNAALDRRDRIFDRLIRRSQDF